MNDPDENDRDENDPDDRPRSRRATLALYALALAILALGVIVRVRRHRAAVEPRFDWLVLVVMPYDNDLDHCADPIVEALTRGVQRGDGRARVAVAVLADRARTDRLTESLVTRHETARWTLGDDDSASVANVEGFFDRMSRRAPARRHVVVFLDHGGAVDQLGVDHHPAPARSEAWLPAAATGEALRRWRARTRADVALLFLQQCGRGSIEVALAFRRVADVVLASQTYVGSCNTYYEPLIDRLRTGPSLAPREVGSTIMAEDEHYTTYAMYDGRALEGWPARADALVSALRAANVSPSGALRAIEPTFVADEQESLDLLAAAERLAAPRGADAVREASAFSQWVRGSLVLGQRRRGAGPAAASWSGVSTVIPRQGATDAVRALPGWAGTRWIEWTELARSER